MDVTITIERPGYRIKRRRLKKSKIHPKHLMNPLESMIFLNTNFNVKIVEEYVVKYY